jgi:hypothetical protein
VTDLLDAVHFDNRRKGSFSVGKKAGERLKGS